MTCVLVTLVLILLLGPLRRWAGRHWAFLASVTVGGVLGLLLGSVIAGMGAPAYTPLLGMAAGALVFGESGPAILRHIEKDGRS